MARIDFTTLARVKTHLEAGGADPLGGEDDAFDDYLEELIDSYSAQMERYLGRASKDESRTETLDVYPGQRVFALKGYPNVDITSVRHDADRTFTGSTISASDYTIDDDNGLLIVDDYLLSAGNRVFRVVYEGGLATNTAGLVSAFPDLAHACDLQVVYHFKRADNLGSSAQSFGDQNKSWVGALDWLPTVRETLDRHRRVRF